MFIGLTGGIASGKSTVSKMMQGLGLPIIDADLIAREVVEPNSVGLRLIVERFGEVVLAENGTLNRAQLGQIIFANPTKRIQLNDLIHPLIRERMNERKEQLLAAGRSTIVYDIPLLYESELFHLVDNVLLVYVDQETQLKRLMKRNQLSEREALERIQSQMSLEQKKERADAIIDNTRTLAETHHQLISILQNWHVLFE
ncbi:dephospho-CoA kinase [Alkalihalobacillus hemicellulosilyticus]|uniref:Dephospho-CoA kinase n=1 Tax=Halalkalibacter hemicellulosilyticusJCM 9152 TaxID=1236971 RepID=W4QFK7_9BACI|nr:dephospho-CoA kinase [Halalkalibacter hemicellulosilyticus]GAE30129.1 dephospho-CoA kinase [Halalkalibacter hemicellulosilyticusJCM 9152]